MYNNLTGMHAVHNIIMIYMSIYISLYTGESKVHRLNNSLTIGTFSEKTLVVSYGM